MSRMCAALLLYCIFFVSPAVCQTPEAAPVFVSPPVAPRSVTVPPERLQPARELGPPVTVPEGEPLPQVPPPARAPVVDPTIQRQTTAQARPEATARESSELFATPEINVAGITANANPPDTVGDVGPNHYVQMVNATQFGIYDKKIQIFDKSGVLVFGPAIFGNLWPEGDICRSNRGDPIVVYDHLADRWLLSQFARPNHMCIAISQTADPTAGTWFLYTFDTRVFPDYPKFGVWPDGYYMSSYEAPNLGVYVFDRAQMVVGSPATFMKRTIAALGAPGVRDTRILPADLDGPPPAAGTPNFFVRTVDDQQDPANPRDRIEIYSATANFAGPTFAFTLIHTLTPAPFQTMLCNRNGSGFRDCIPQPDTDATVDALSNRPMMQLKFRHFSAHHSMVLNQTIDVSGSMPIPVRNEVAGIRWYELRNAGTGWSIFQQSTYAPQPADLANERQLLHRWMGSAAMDAAGNIALGYSVTNSDGNNKIFPGIGYAGRHFDDPISTLPRGENIIFNGTNSQTGGFGQRWGDYSALSVDPKDNCTFWYTTHLAGAGGTGPRPTRIASFRFDNCAKPKPRVAFKYAAKIVCGTQPDENNLRLTRGLYATAINILNPNSKAAKFSKKLALTYPPDAQEPGAVYNISIDTLKPDEALEVDCEDLKRTVFRNGMPASYIKGFVVIKSDLSLDVTGVYTTRALDVGCCTVQEDNCCAKNPDDCCGAKQNECCKPQRHRRDGARATAPGGHSSIHVEQIRERRVEEEQDPKLADLIPVPKADRPYPPEAFCRIKDKGLLITVRNQGEGAAEASVTEVLFTAVNVPVVRPTPQLAPGGETDVHFAFPPNGCTAGGELCPFRITVDRGATVTESNEANNVAQGSCLFLL
jgi:hypothetical protein